MKLSILMGSVALAATAYGQNTDAQHAPKQSWNEGLPAWCIDANFKGGILGYNMTTANMAANYLNSIQPYVSELRFKDGRSAGGDVQLGYFFGRKKHFGVGIGFLYFSQSGSFEMDNFHIEYQSADSRGDMFRQIVTANRPITEELKMTNVQIPFVLKYKTMFSKKWGFTVDAGLTYNAQMTTQYATNATFDYEAIYNYRLVNGAPVAFYDNSPAPSGGAWLITKANYTDKNPESNISDAFTQLQIQGYNVALVSEPANRSGEVNYSSKSVGLLVNPSASYMLSAHVALNLGVYYMQQSLKNENTASYRITDRVGSYNSLVKSNSVVSASNYGVNFGLRIYLVGAKDRDKDGVPDRRDDCPDVAGLRWFRGCPDRDMDSVMDIDDDCPDLKGLVKYKGCPDTDGDGVIDRNDGCPSMAGLPALRGCPDKDGDGIADMEDACPDQKGKVAMMGCPDTDGDGIADPKDECPESAGLTQFNGCPDRDNDGTPDSKDKCPDVPGPAENAGCPSAKRSTLNVDMIQFETGTSVIAKRSYHIIDDAVKVLKSDESAVLRIDGHADITGTRSLNKRLSRQRAEAVKHYFLKKGVPADRLIATGHGSDEPIDSNDTREGRARNRRVVMAIKYIDN